jgi:alginate O-acetyltransferase complex protein AlgJ
MSAPVARRSHRTADLVLVALFVASISLPLAANVAGIDGADAGAENRELAALPRIDRAWSSMIRFGPGLSLWFEDHFGFRASLVRWYGESRLFLLGVSPSTAVVKGRHGWFFYGDDKAIEDYVNDEPMSPAAMANWRAAIGGAQAWLRARGIGYVFTIAPDKHVVYPEEMPPALRRVGSVSRIDQVYQALHGSGVVAVDVRTRLLDAKAHDRVYHRTDTHWNDRGALVAYQAIITAVRAQVPSTPAPWTRADFTPVVRDVEAMDLGGMMGLRRVLREQDLALLPNRLLRARVVEPSGAEADAEEGRLVTEIADTSLPRAVVFRDSFASRLAPFLSEHFSRAVYLWQNDFDADAVIREKPDVVIQEIVGRHLYSFIPSPELVPTDR